MHEAWGDWYGLDSARERRLRRRRPDCGGRRRRRVPDRRTGDPDTADRLSGGNSSPNCPDLGFGAGPGGYTFGDMGTVIPFPEVHEDGQIWAQTMWQLRDVLGSAVMEGLATRGQELAPTTRPSSTRGTR